MEFRDPFSSPQTGALGQTEAVGFDAGLRAYMLRIYNYMASALALTGVVAMVTANSPALLQVFYVFREGQIVGVSGLSWFIALVTFGLGMWLILGIRSMSKTTALTLYWSYAILTGISFSSIFLAYTGASIARTFFVTAGVFGGMSIYGYTTKRDLTGIGYFLIMGLFGLIIATIVNWFLRSAGLDFVLSVIGVIIFTGLTAYDTQKFKDIYYQGSGSTEAMAKASIIGAFNLYLDFILLFRYLIDFMGQQRR